MSARVRSKAVDPIAEARGRPLADSVLELVWRQKQISRAEIARSTGLSRSTVSEIVTSLLASNLVTEVGSAPSRGGRRPILLEFNDDAHVILGVDLGASHVSVALTDLRGAILAWNHRAHPVREDPDGSVALVRELSESCLADWGGSRDRLLGIGVALPAPVDPRDPLRVSEVVHPRWKGHRGLAELRSHFEVPLFVDNDANLGALAEHWWGAGQGIDDFAYLKVATGVGSGHMIRGEIYRGASGVAGEIGHVAIDPGGDLCDCGNRGCLTTFVGTAALLARIDKLLPDYPDSLLARGEVTPEAFEQAALADDPLALHVVYEAAEHLASAIAGVLNVMNPAAVIIGGSLSNLDERLLVPLREAVIRRTLLSSLASAEIRTSALGPQDIALGAATYVLHRALKDPRLFPGVASS